MSNKAGFGVSLVVLLALCISMYFVIIKTETDTTTVPAYNTTVVTENQYANRTIAPVVLDADTVASWGDVPGNYESTYSTDVSVVTYPSPSTWDAKTLHAHAAAGTLEQHMLMAGPGIQKNVTLTRNTNSTVTTAPSPIAQNTISYSISNDFTPNFTESEEVYTVNYDGLGIWWQMTNQPMYIKAWQSLSQVANKMYTQDFLNFYYAAMIHAGYAGNQIWANNVVLQGLSPQDQAAIYDDTFYGMRSIRNLTIWMAAADGSQDAQRMKMAADAQKVLANHWFSGSYQLTADQLLAMTGETSAFTGLISQCNEKIQQAGIVSESAEITSQFMGQLQWSSGKLLNNPALGFDTFIAYGSMMDLGMNFLQPPEIALQGCSATIEESWGNWFLNPVLTTMDVKKTVNNEQTFLSPVNYYNFETALQTQDIATLNTTFGVSMEQAQCLQLYSESQANYVTYQAEANLITKAADRSISQLQGSATGPDYVPTYGGSLAFNLAARTLAYNNTANEIDCDFYLRDYSNNSSAVCQNMNMSEVDDVTFFLNGAWYGDRFKEEIMQAAQMNETSYTAFYDITQENNFGARMMWTQQNLAALYECPSYVQDPAVNPNYFEGNCTAEFLAWGQWGSSMVTRNPPATNTPENAAFYFPCSVGQVSNCTTVAPWSIPGVEGEPEYFYYAEEYDAVEASVELTAHQVGNMSGSDYSYFGLNNTYNVKQLYYDYTIRTNTNPTPYLSAAAINWNMNITDLYTVMNGMDYMVQEYVLGGLTRNSTLGDIVFGYPNALAQELSPFRTLNYTDYYWRTGDAIYYNDDVNPILSSQQGSGENVTLTIQASSEVTNSTAGRITLMGDFAYPNRLVEVNAGTGMTVKLPIRCSPVNFTEDPVFNWQSNMVENSTNDHIMNLNLVNYQAIESSFESNSTICSNGTGSAHCSTNMGGYDNETGWLIFPTNSYKNVHETVTMQSQCGSQVPLSGTQDVMTTIDQATGSTTSYTTTFMNQLHWGQLSPDGVHPFPTIKLLQKMLGEDMIIPLSNVQDSFNVASSAFVNTSYPVYVNPDTDEPTYRTQNETVTTEHPAVTTTSDKTSVVTWALVLYIVLIIVFLFLTVFFCMRMKHENDEEDSGVNVESKTVGYGNTLGQQLVNDTAESASKREGADF